jgi:hypothetical protein
MFAACVVYVLAPARGRSHVQGVLPSVHDSLCVIKCNSDSLHSLWDRQKGVN